MLPSLRPLIAESMRAMAHRRPIRVTTHLNEHLRLLDGADTLDWCDANDPDNELSDCLGLAAQIESLEDDLDAIQAALDDWIASKMARPADFRDKLRRLVDSRTA